MENFAESRWADAGFSQEYRDKSSLYLPLRGQFIEVARFGFESFVTRKDEAKILDLGCGDGLFIHELSRFSTFSKATLVDASSEMLEAAKVRLEDCGNVDFVQASFHEVMDNDLLEGSFDFIYSSLAIHHLRASEKKRLYSYIYKLLAPGGWFFHYDVVLSPTPLLETWHLSLWREWIKRHSVADEAEGCLDIPGKYKSNPDNIPDTLESQEDFLKNVGFSNVDCVFKFAIFALFIGSKS